MNVTLTYNLPDEKEELFEALHGIDWILVIQNVMNELRAARKWRCEETYNIEKLEAFVYDELAERGLELW